MSSSAKRVLTGVTLALAVVGLLWLDSRAPESLVPWFVASALSLLSAWELGRMGAFKLLRFNPAMMLAGVFVALLVWFERDELCSLERPYLVLLAGWLLVALSISISSLSPLVMPSSARKLALPLALWALVPLHGLVWVDHAYGIWGLACLVIFSKIGDIFGYFVGRAIGKRHPFKVLSPNKTVAGCVASLLSAVALGVLLGALGKLPCLQAGSLAAGLTCDQAGPWAGALIGASMNLASQAGDLLESLVKRTALVKDSSSLAGASGGVLDVIDSLLLSIPMALATWPWLL